MVYIYFQIHHVFPNFCLGFRYLQELLPYCPQFYTDSVGRELLAELRATTTQSLETMETETTTGSSPQDSIELKIPHIVTQPW